MSKKKVILIPFAMLGLTACQLTTETDQKKAQAACESADDTAGCFELTYQDLRDVRMEKRAAAGPRIVLSPSPPMRRDTTEETDIN